MKFSEQIQSLKEALALSPTNLPLRRMLAEALAAGGHIEMAEEEYRKALKINSSDAKSKYGLATIHCTQGKNATAIVLLEDLLHDPLAPAEARTLYEDLCRKTGDKPDEHLLASMPEEPSNGEWKDPALRAQALPEFTVDGMVRQTAEEGAPSDIDTEIERPSVNFSNVGGMGGVKEEISIKIILPLTNKDLYKAYGKSMGGGILLYGPPGCGKTHIAKATAGQINAGFLSVGLHDVLDMWIGQSEQKLHGIFEHARRNKPCVIFFDEVDALAASRSDMRTSAGRHLINQFLSELDGFASNNDGVLILAATNAPWHLDSAFRRPGRFDRCIFVPPPDADARREILGILLAGKPVDSIDYAKIARKTEEYSGADLKAVVDMAVEVKLKQALKTGKLAPISTADLLAAAQATKLSTKEWFATARNYALYANDSGVYDEILKHLKMK
ncbi:MAG: AAA family ATPase [Magnetococcus sp. WYHC-3]